MKRRDEGIPENLDRDFIPEKCGHTHNVPLHPDQASKFCDHSIQNKYHLLSRAHIISNRLHELIIHEGGEFGIDPRLSDV
jgi:hypothetical protein